MIRNIAVARFVNYERGRFGTVDFNLWEESYIVRRYFL